MILSSGFLQPQRFQIDEARVKADESFCALSSKTFLNNFPVFPGWENAEESVTLLKLKNVTPHNDVWVSRGSQPRVRRAIFWLLEGGGQSSFGQHLIFGCGRKHVTMKPGDFVVFNDNVDHWVMSEKLWRGAAIQLSKSK
jgi:mannose-6-phosphate isomerase-like protein (cupin superfamily)